MAAFFKPFNTLVEIKSANDYSFGEMVRLGVRLAQPKYFAQVQQYELHGGMDQAFYVAINKNNCDVYTELIPFDREYALAITEKHQRIWSLTRDGILPEPEYHKASSACRQCPYAQLCDGLPAPKKTGTIRVGR